jgi:hypothetical protein
MRTVKQKESLSVVNLDNIIGRGHTFIKKKHGPLLPNSIRAVICGPSNCGKTNLMLSLLFDKNGLKFQNIYIYSKSLNQPKCVYLKKVMDSLKEIGFYQYRENAEILPPSRAKKHSIFIFDDVACHKQNNIKKYFSMGRHSDVDSFYLCQTYSSIPKQLIRDNVNFIVLFRQDELNLKHIYQDHVGADMRFEQFKQLCSESWKEKYGYFVIDKDSNANNGRYRKKLDEFIVL